MSSIIAFPETLASEIDKGGDHVSFEIIGKGFDTDVFKIHLYVPAGISTGDGANFGNVNLGVIEGMGEKIAAGANAAANSSGALDTAVNTLGAVVNTTKLEGIGITSAILQKMGVADDSAKALGLKAGVAFNNRTALTYEGSNIRQFQLSFQLVASSRPEAETIRKIEHTFRKYMYAKREGTFALTYPALFRIKFMKGKNLNEYMPFIFDSYLTGMTASYNNNANMFHDDGAPTDINIQLSFQEQRQLTRDDLYNDENGAQQSFSYPKSK